MTAGATSPAAATRAASRAASRSEERAEARAARVPSAPARALAAPTADDLVDAVATLALTACGVVGFATSFGGRAWLGVAVLGGVLGLLVAQLAGRPRRSLGTLTVAALVVAVLGAPPVLPDTAAAGVLPTVETLRALVEGGLQGWLGMLDVVPPIGGAYHLLAVPYLAAFLTTLLAHSCAVRRPWPWPPLLAPAALVVATILFGTSDPAAPLVQGPAFAVGALAWVVVRGRRRRALARGGTVGLPVGAPVVGGLSALRTLAPAAAVLALAGTFGALTGGHQPFLGDRPRYVLRDVATPPFDPHQFPSPLGRFRRYVTDEKTTELMRVSGLKPGARIRLATMDAYDGVVWSVAGGVGPSEGSSGWFEKVGDTIPTDLGDGDVALPAGSPVRARIEVRRPLGVWVPGVGATRSVEFSGPRADVLREDLRFNRLTQSAAVPIGLRTGDVVTLDADVPGEADLEDLADRGIRGVAQPDPPRMPQSLDQYVSGAVEDVGDPTARAQALAKKLREGYYSDGEETGGRVTWSRAAGHGLARLSEMFRADPVGDDEQFAAAYALALRGLDIPSRVVLGFVVSEKHPDKIVGGDAMAWVEVPVDGVGWVAVTPTPDESRTPDSMQPRPQPRRQVNNQAEPPPPAVVPDQAVDAEQPRRRTEDDRDSRPAWLGVLILVAEIAAPFLLIALICGVIVGVKARRRARRRRASRPTARIVGGWLEVTDLAADLGRPVPPRLTRRESGAAIGGSAVALAERADAAVFAPDLPAEDEIEAFWDAVAQHRRQSLAELPWWRRILARLSLASLRRRS